MSELDRGESDLTGLILLDLPDHWCGPRRPPSRPSHLTADLIWVLDPQKYADAAVHHRYLAEMSGHGQSWWRSSTRLTGEPDDVESCSPTCGLLEDESGVHLGS